MRLNHKPENLATYATGGASNALILPLVLKCGFALSSRSLGRFTGRGTRIERTSATLGKRAAQVHLASGSEARHGQLAPPKRTQRDLPGSPCWTREAWFLMRVLNDISQIDRQGARFRSWLRKRGDQMQSDISKRAIVCGCIALGIGNSAGLMIGRSTANSVQPTLPTQPSVAIPAPSAIGPSLPPYSLLSFLARNDAVASALVLFGALAIATTGLVAVLSIVVCIVVWAIRPVRPRNDDMGPRPPAGAGRAEAAQGVQTDAVRTSSLQAKRQETQQPTELLVKMLNDKDRQVLEFLRCIEKMRATNDQIRSALDGGFPLLMNLLNEGLRGIRESLNEMLKRLPGMDDDGHTE